MLHDVNEKFPRNSVKYYADRIISSKFISIAFNNDVSMDFMGRKYFLCQFLKSVIKPGLFKNWGLSSNISFLLSAIIFSVIAISSCILSLKSLA